MFREEQLNGIFERVSGTIESPIDVYLIGGLAMIKNGMKLATKDVDVVFESEKDAREFIRAALLVGFIPDTELPPEYSEMNAIVVLKDDDNNRIDIFVRVVLGHLTYTEAMKARARTVRFGECLRVNVSSNEDIFLFKSITTRPRDLQDMELLARGGNLDWRAIEKEVLEQPGSWKYVGRLYGRLLELEHATGMISPLTASLEKEAELSQAAGILLHRIVNAALTLDMVKEIIGEGDEFAEEVMAFMKRHGLM